MLQNILLHFGLDDISEVTPFGNGLINNTWFVKADGNEYVLQKINHKIFKNPQQIAANIKLIGEYLAKNNTNYLFVTPIKTDDDKDLLFINEEYFRLFPYVKNSITVNVVSNTKQAYEAAKQFGKFTKVLSKFPHQNLQITLPNFHNLPLRYKQFEQSITEGNAERVEACTELIYFLKKEHKIVDDSIAIENNTALKKRVTHHDTKISNVLFDENDNGICVIDLDTVMPGYFISDFGDMVRTYVCPVNEEECNFDKIEIREDYFKAIAQGYLYEMNIELSNDEKANLVYAGKFMIYMQALRFLTDYFNNDAYYGSKYANHNLVRAKNQAVLLDKLMQKEKLLLEFVQNSF